MIQPTCRCSRYRSLEDKQAPAKRKATYAIRPTSGKTTPATLVVTLGHADPGSALVYEPCDHPASADEPQSVGGEGGAPRTKPSSFHEL